MAPLRKNLMESCRLNNNGTLDYRFDFVKEGARCNYYDTSGNLKSKWLNKVYHKTWLAAAGVIATLMILGLGKLSITAIKSLCSRFGYEAAAVAAAASEKILVDAEVQTQAIHWGDLVDAEVQAQFIHWGGLDDVDVPVIRGEQVAQRGPQMLAFQHMQEMWTDQQKKIILNGNQDISKIFGENS